MKRMLSVIPTGILALPPPMIRAHGVDISGCSPSTQIFRGAICRRIAGGDIAGPPRLHVVRNRSSTCLLESLDDVQHAVPPSRSQVDGKACGLVERRERGQMTLGEIHDVDIISHTRSIRRVVIAAPNVQAVAEPNRNLGYKRQE